MPGKRLFPIFVLKSYRGRSVNQPISVQISAGAFIFLALLLLLLPLQWVFAVVFAALIHECCHCLAVFLLGENVRRIYIGGRGAVIDVAPMSGIREALCALAGPLGSFLLVALIRWMPRTAICGLIHGFYNLLPMLPFDGGRILRGVLTSILSPPMAETCMKWIRRILLFLAGVLCLLLASRLIFLPIFALIWYFLMGWRENPLAKLPFWRYNSRTIDSEVRL